MSLLEQEPLLDVDQIQGNILRGFDTQWLQLVGLKTESEPVLRTWLKGLAPKVSSLKDVHAYRLARTNGTLHNPAPVLINIAISGIAIRLLRYNLSDIGDGMVNLPMGDLARSLGDSPEDVASFKIGKDKSTSPEVLLLIGCEDKETLLGDVKALIGSAEAAGLTVIYTDLGTKLPNEIEHFGFKDGISQVGVRGLLNQDPLEPLTLRIIKKTDPNFDHYGSPGQPLVWPGQFIFGYPMQQESSLEPGPVSGKADWLRNGSLLVFRRLNQDVRKFQSFLNEQAAAFNLSCEQLGAKVVGRWPDGTPTTLSPDAPDTDLANNPLRLNHFAYGGQAAIVVQHDDGSTQTVAGNAEDNAGLRCPHLAHVRKVNPRNLHTDQGGPGRTLMMQMIRRGIPFGPAFDPREEDVPDRGLLFISYQTSISKQFKKLNTQWMNNPDAPEVGDQSHDLLVGQSLLSKERIGSFPNGSVLKTEDKWVRPSGGAFMFSPSIDFLKGL